MSEKDLRPSALADVALPVRMVRLKHLKSATGEPIVVQCERLEPLRIFEIVEALPGWKGDVVGSTSDADAREQMRKFRPLGERLIEAGCALLDSYGRPQRRAFSFSDDAGTSVPGRFLDTDDFMLLANTILELGGYAGGAATEGSFPSEKRQEPKDGVETSQGRPSDETPAP